MLALIALAFVFALILLEYSANNPHWVTSSQSSEVLSIVEFLGAYVAYIGLAAFGFMVFLIPIAIAQFGWNYQRRWKDSKAGQLLHPILFFAGFVLTLISGCGLENLYSTDSPNFSAGGILGNQIVAMVAPYMRAEWAALILIGVFILGTSALRLIPWIRIVNATGRGFLSAFDSLWFVGTKAERQQKEVKEVQFVEPQEKKSKGFFRKSKIAKEKEPKPANKRRSQKRDLFTGDRVDPVIVPLEDNFENEPGGMPFATQLVEPEPVIPQMEPPKPKPSPARKLQPESKPQSLPDTSLLDPANRSAVAYSRQEIDEMSTKVETMLSDFNVDVVVRQAHPGPVITQLEIEPAPGIKASQIANLSTDIARTLTVQSIRVVDNIQGSPYVGLEVPNRKREIVRLVDGLESREYKNATHPLTIVLGKDIRGKTVVSNLASMPHLLIAGTTGAGKSVCLNAILLSFLYKSTAEEIKLLMIDPKMLEFSVYEGIPHLLVPVITEMSKTENALLWCISEMERRFGVMAELGVRNLENLNEKIRKSSSPIADPTAPNPETASTLVPFPYIVFIIDELSDLIMVMGKKAEELIIRIAQRARAAGIHLIVATQRPSADVIRGILKANIPTRISFKVASNADSRTILDQPGAETLLGQGDMLFIPPGSGSVMRVHGAFVSDDEVKRVVDRLKQLGGPSYDDEVTAALSGAHAGGEFDGNGTVGNGDELYNSALDFVVRSRRPTISSVQRHLRIGYNRAARIIEAMEHAGAISSVQAGGKREVLIPPPQD